GLPAHEDIAFAHLREVALIRDEPRGTARHARRGGHAPQDVGAVLRHRIFEVDSLECDSGRDRGRRGWWRPHRFGRVRSLPRRKLAPAPRDKVTERPRRAERVRDLSDIKKEDFITGLEDPLANEALAHGEREPSRVRL